MCRIEVLAVAEASPGYLSTKRFQSLVLTAGADGQVDWRLALNPFFSNMVFSWAALTDSIIK